MVKDLNNILMRINSDVDQSEYDYILKRGKTFINKFKNKYNINVFLDEGDKEHIINLALCSLNKFDETKGADITTYFFTILRNLFINNNIKNTKINNNEINVEAFESNALSTNEDLLF